MRFCSKKKSIKKKYNRESMELVFDLKNCPEHENCDSNWRCHWWIYLM